MVLTFHGSLDFLHRLQDLAESIIDFLARAMLLKRVDDLQGTGNERTSLLDHINVGQDEASFRALGVKTPLEGADQTKVRVLAETLGRISDSVVKQSIRGSIRHERWKVQAGDC